MSMSAASNSARPLFDHNNSTNKRGSRPPVSSIHEAGRSSPTSVRTTVRKTPVVYPALLSRVAQAFRDRIPITDRVKDGLTYKDAFDGREAVDKIAYIIKTTDRNLALLLGRALDAQKFFHDVTYDHRLRDSSNELYRFRTKLPSPFVSGEMAEIDHTNDKSLLGGTPSRVCSCSWNLLSSRLIIFLHRVIMDPHRHQRHHPRTARMRQTRSPCLLVYLHS